MRSERRLLNTTRAKTSTFWLQNVQKLDHQENLIFVHIHCFFIFDFLISAFKQCEAPTAVTKNNYLPANVLITIAGK